MPGRGFRNPWPGHGVQRASSLVRWGIQRLVRGRPPDPDPSTFEIVAPTYPAPRAARDALTVTWIGHAATLIQIGGMNVLTDPMFGERASPVAFAGPRRWVQPGIALTDLPPIDVVLLSHNHYDHFDRNSIRAMAAGHAPADWLVPLRLGAPVRALGVERVRELDWWETIALGPLEVVATPARHFSARGPFDRDRSLWCGWVLRAGRCSVYFAGDTGYHPDFKGVAERLGPFDISLLPIGAYDPQWFMRPVHLNPEEAVRAFVDLGGRDRGVMGAIHWGTFKLTDEPMDEPPRRVRAAWRAAGLPEDRLWIPRHGETLVL